MPPALPTLRYIYQKVGKLKVYFVNVYKRHIIRYIYHIICEYVAKKVMRLSKIKLVEGNIKDYFNSLMPKVFLQKDLYQILAENHRLWGLRKTMSVANFIDHLKKMHLNEIKLSSPNYDKTYTRFAWGREVSIYQLSLSLKPRSYFTHHTAMLFHGLTDKRPAIIYVNSEQSPKFDREADLIQESIDRAFKGKARTSKYLFTYKKWTICCLNGINTKQLTQSS